MINDRFKSYFRENFFECKESEFKDFLEHIEKPLKKTIRIHPEKRDMIIDHLTADGYILTPTTLGNVYEIERGEDFDPLERRLGYSLDHLVGNFYIQELAAAHPVDILAGGQVDRTPYLILDMASSPGGKTTELAEYYPECFIIAYEPTRERIPQLLQNLDRMGSTNIWVTLYPGQYFAREAEVFDRILLDAPCSGEGTAFRGGDVLGNWHIKNVKKIAHLQEKLLESALISLKVWGEMVYSTCTLNTLEDEEVVDAMMVKYPGTFEILFQKKWWPHIDKTGGFFVTKIRKTWTIEPKWSILPEKSNDEINRLKDLQWLPEHDRIGKKMMYYRFRDKILTVRDHSLLEKIRMKYYFMRFWQIVAKIDTWYVLDHIAGRILPLELPLLELADDEVLDRYLRGDPMIQTWWEDWEYLTSYKDILIGYDRVKNSHIENLFPHDWRRK